LQIIDTSWKGILREAYQLDGIVNAIKCVKSNRLHLDNLRRDGWAKLLDDEVNEFYDMHDIARLEMEDAYVDPKKSRKKNLELHKSITTEWTVSVKL
jgi:hypothetical protein